jgi:hypothetical protein
MRYDGFYWIAHIAASSIVIRDGGVDGVNQRGVYPVRQIIETDTKLTSIAWSTRPHWTTVGTGQLAASSHEGDLNYTQFKISCS